MPASRPETLPEEHACEVCTSRDTYLSGLEPLNHAVLGFLESVVRFEQHATHGLGEDLAICDRVREMKKGG